MFPQCWQFPIGKHCFQCQFLFSSCKLCLRYTEGNFKENPSLRAIRAKAKFCEHFQIGCDHSTPLVWLGEDRKCSADVVRLDLVLGLFMVNVVSSLLYIVDYSDYIESRR